MLVSLVGGTVFSLLCCFDSSVKGHLTLQTHGPGFPGGSVVKYPPAVQETQETLVRSLAQQDPLEEGRATHSSILAWRIPWTEEPGGLQSKGLKQSDRTEQLSRHTPALKESPPYVNPV